MSTRHNEILSIEDKVTKKLIDLYIILMSQRAQKPPGK